MSTIQQDIHTELIAACRLGNRKAQYQLYKLYVKAMFSLAMRILNNSAEAEDVVQDAFLDAFTKIQTFKEDATFGAWLKRITINKAINQLKKYKNIWLSMDNQDFIEDKNDVSREEEIQWQITQVHQAIQKLPDGFRVVLSLYLLEGYDHNEIAEILDISVSTSKTQYIRAKQKLLKILQMN